ncbi:MAG: DUF2911 domain-containing protein [Ekhidna sp.]
MKKLLIFIIIVLIIGGGIFYLNNRNRTLSPPEATELTFDGLEVKVDYSRPSVRERTIFGYEEEGALLPYDEYWRLGANEPTIISVSKPFVFGGQNIDAGKYAIYGIPRRGEIEIVLTNDIQFWGYTEPNYDLDIASAVVRINRGEFTEQFTISPQKAKGGVNLVFNWGNHTWRLPIGKQ